LHQCAGHTLCKSNKNRTTDTLRQNFHKFDRMLINDHNCVVTRLTLSCLQKNSGLFHDFSGLAKRSSRILS